MRMYELFEQVRWAMDKNIDKATNVGRSDLTDPEYVMVWVDIRDLFSKTDPGFRLDVDDPRGGPIGIGNRVQDSKEHWSSGGYMDLAVIGFNSYGNYFGFTNGRHRLVAAYQLGEQWAPVLVDTESVDKLKELVNTK